MNWHAVRMAALFLCAAVASAAAARSPPPPRSPISPRPSPLHINALTGRMTRDGEAALLPRVFTREDLVLLACGSFNPPTRAHLNMFALAKRYFGSNSSVKLTQGILSPVGDHYAKAGLIEAHHRLRMVELAAGHYDWLSADAWESSQPTWIETYKVMAHFNERLNASRARRSRPVRPMLLCGGDVFDTFVEIRNGERVWAKEDVIRIIEFGVIVIERIGSNVSATIEKLDEFVSDEAIERIVIVDVGIEDAQAMNISSTKVRDNLRRGLPVDHMIFPEVERYIRANNLYGVVPIQAAEKLDKPPSGRRRISTRGSKRRSTRAR